MVVGASVVALPLTTLPRSNQCVPINLGFLGGREAGKRVSYRRLSCRATSGGSFPQVTASGVIDYYELLGVDDDASVEDIKNAYRYLAKQCHPDYLGNEGHDMCVLLNEAYDVLCDPQQRSRYNARLQQHLEDSKDDFTGRALLQIQRTDLGISKPLSKWLVGHRMGKNEDPNERRAVFVDEVTCIGCKMCVWNASATFRIEPEHGRSRVFAQWVDTEDKIQGSIDSCPVNCIHWVDLDELPALEYVTRNIVGRTDVSAMMAGQGNAAPDVFAAAARFMKERRAKAEAAAAAGQKYSPAQQEARRQAEEAIRQQSGGWWGSFAGAFASAFAGGKAPSSYTSAGGPSAGDDDLVGRRKRAPRKALNPGGGMVPLERALVPISVYAKEP